MFGMCLCFGFVSPSSSSLMSLWPESDWTEVELPLQISHSSKHKYQHEIFAHKKYNEKHPMTRSHICYFYAQSESVCILITV